MTTSTPLGTAEARHAPGRPLTSSDERRRRRLDVAHPASPTTWWPDVGAVLVTLGASLWEIGRIPALTPSSSVLMSVHLGLVVMSAAMYRRSPALALVLVWLSFAVQLAIGSTVGHAGVVVLVVVLVAYGAARYGHLLTVCASAALVVLSTSLTVHLVMSSPWRLERVPFPLRTVTENLEGSLAGVVLAILLGTGLLAPWAVGGMLRLRERARRSESDRARATIERDEAERQRSLAHELADLRANQARLARDVHDVVGHSLAVVLAQAESAQYLSEHDPDALRRSMANIATSARTSLMDIRTVLASIDGTQAEGPAPHGTLETLLDDVRAAGTPVEEATTGTPRPLPPELETVAYRVLQEMLTNALKHGARGEPVQVEREWDEDLHLTVENVTGDVTRGVVCGVDAGRASVGTASDVTSFDEGLGVASMRRRLAQVGGTLDLTRATGADGAARVRAAARLPLSRALRAPADQTHGAVPEGLA